MVDRPIKKSDREAAQQSQPADTGSGETPSSEARKVPPPVKKADRKDGGPASRDSRDSRDDRGRGGKGRGKGRGRGKDDAPRTPMNPALMRGPKPTPKVEKPEEPEETAVEAGADADGADAAGAETETAAPEATAEATPEADAAPAAAE